MTTTYFSADIESDVPASIDDLVSFLENLVEFGTIGRRDSRSFEVTLNGLLVEVTGRDFRYGRSDGAVVLNRGTIEVLEIYDNVGLAVRIDSSIDARTINALLAAEATDPGAFESFLLGIPQWSLSLSDFADVASRLTPIGDGGVLFHTPGDDDFNGAGGDDDLYGGAGNDVIVGGRGDDTLDGGTGNDRLVGQSGNDVLFGDDGRDFLDGGIRNDSLSGGDGNDQLMGRSGNDTLLGGNGSDTLRAGTGNDTVGGGRDGDSMEGGDGNDRLTGEHGDDIVFGGSGNDRLTGDGGNDRLFGDAGNDVVSGGTGNDRIDGGEGNDVLYGDAGNDRINGGAGNDRITGGTGSDTLTGGTGADRFEVTRGSGLDRITDFVIGADVVVVRGTGETLDSITITAVSGGALATGRGWQVQFDGLAAQSLDAADFLFL